MSAVANLFEFHELLGEGFYGKVWLAQEKDGGRDCAVKEIDRSKMTKKHKERLDLEVEILSLAKHPYVVPFRGYYEEDQFSYIALEYFSGGDLFSLITSMGRLPEEIVIPLFSQLLRGIQYVHENGYAHRDIKPENIFLEGNDHCVLGDFGLACRLGEENREAVGSLDYAAPELLLESDYDGRKADVWSVGVVLFAMLCGYLPFQGASDFAIFKAIVGCKYSLPRHLPALAADMLSLIFVADPVARPSIEDLTSHGFVSSEFANGQNSRRKVNILSAEELDGLLFQALSRSTASQVVLDESIADKYNSLRDNATKDPYRFNAEAAPRFFMQTPRTHREFKRFDTSVLSDGRSLSVDNRHSSRYEVDSDYTEETNSISEAAPLKRGNTATFSARSERKNPSCESVESESRPRFPRVQSAEDSNNFSAKGGPLDRVDSVPTLAKYDHITVVEYRKADKKGIWKKLWNVFSKKKVKPARQEVEEVEGEVDREAADQVAYLSATSMAFPG